MNKRSVWWGIGIACAVLGAFGFLAILASAFSPSNPYRGSFFGGGRVALLSIDGPITLADDLLEEIRQAQENNQIKAVVLRVNSPGGSVGASQEIYHALKRLDATKPVVASFGNVAASGGYYVGLAARRIYALPGTITASIGVRMSHVNAEELLRVLGVQPAILKSGHFKDIGAMHRPMRAEEEALLNDLLATMHAQFKAAVAKARGLSPAQVDAVADGRVLTGAEALAAGLVDAEGDLHDAIHEAGRLVGLDDPQVIRLKKSAPWWVELLTADSHRLTSGMHAMLWGQLFNLPLVGYFWGP